MPGKLGRDVDRGDEVKELLKKKRVKISILIIILLVLMGVVGINVRNAQRQREYDAHIAAAEKYLTELDYEQAIAEYTMAFEINPKEEVVDALEQTYLVYAQTYMDAGDYEKAVSVLEECYEKTRRESVQNKIEEVRVVQEETLAKEAEIQEQKRIEEEQRASGMVEFPFQMTDITFMGFDLSGDYFEQLLDLLITQGELRWSNSDGAYPRGGGYASDGWMFEMSGLISEYDGTLDRIMWLSQEGKGTENQWQYIVAYRSEGPEPRLDLTAGADRVFDYEEVNVPVKTGETYEDWCRVMQIDRIKENDLRPEERDGSVGILDEKGRFRAVYGAEGEHWLFSSGGYQGIYEERDSGDGYRHCMLRFVITDHQARKEWPIKSIQADINADGVISRINYYGWPVAE